MTGYLDIVVCLWPVDWFTHSAKTNFPEDPWHGGKSCTAVVVEETSHIHHHNANKSTTLVSIMNNR